MGKMEYVEAVDNELDGKRPAYCRKGIHFLIYFNYFNREMP